MLVSLLVFSICTYCIWSLACLEINMRKARAFKVPLIRTPFGANNYIWVILQPIVWHVLNRLSIPWSSCPDFIRFSHRNWHFLEKSNPTACFGPVWALVSPAGMSLHFSDPDAIEEIYSRWRDFVRPIHKYRKLLPRSSIVVHLSHLY